MLNENIYGKYFAHFKELHDYEIVHQPGRSQPSYYELQNYKAGNIEKRLRVFKLEKKVKSIL